MSSGNCALIHAITHITEPILGDSLNYLQGLLSVSRRGTKTGWGQTGSLLRGLGSWLGSTTCVCGGGQGLSPRASLPAGTR